MVRIMTCLACGGVGHLARDGLCSRVFLAERAVRAGELTVAEAAELHGVNTISIYGRRYRVNAMSATWASFDRVARIRCVDEIRQQREHGMWIGYRRSMVNAVELMEPLPLSDELEVPKVDARGSEHEEVPDPPHLVEVGWRTTRPQRTNQRHS